MTRWCPICESPGKPVLRGSLSDDDMTAIQMGAAVRVGKRLPDIEPTHLCSLCPTFFRWRDRFYLTARREKGVHGIGVWPHRQARVRIEMAADGVVFLFGNTNWILANNDTFQRVVSDFFWGHGQREIITWARRRGFKVRLVPTGNGQARLKVDPGGCHFPLLVVKSWAQANDIRDSEVASLAFEEIGASPVVFGPPKVPS